MTYQTLEAYDAALDAHEAEEQWERERRYANFRYDCEECARMIEHFARYIGEFAKIGVDTEIRQEAFMQNGEPRQCLHIALVWGDWKEDGSERTHRLAYHGKQDFLELRDWARQTLHTLQDYYNFASED